MRRLGSDVDELGECPIWNARTARLSRIDVVGRRLVECDADGSNAVVTAFGDIPGSFAPRADNGVLLAYRRRLALRDDHGVETDLPLPAAFDGSRERFNDGACDALGRFWVGTMDRHLQDQVGALYRVDTDLQVHQIASGFGLSNGIAWSPDGQTMFQCDSKPAVIYAYDFDLSHGTVENRRAWVTCDASIGIPDGCAVDEEGFLWVAAPEAGQVLRFDPNGVVERRVKSPATSPTSVAFGGDMLRTLFTTSMQPHGRTAGEADGGLFAWDAPVPGMAQHVFGG